DILGDQYEESQPVQSEDNNAEINTDDITSESISQNSLNNDSDNETGIEDLLKDILGDQYQENQSTHTDKRQSITSIDQIIAEANDQITPLDETQTDQALTNNDEYEYSFSYKNISNSKLDQYIFQVEKLWDELSNSWPVIYKQPEIKLKIEKLWQSLKSDGNGNIDIYSFSNDAIDDLLNEIDSTRDTHDDSISSGITEEHNEKEDNYLTETDSTTQDEDNELSDNSTHEYSHLIDSENHKLTEPYLTTHQELYTDNHDEAEAGIEETETSSGELEDQKEESDERLSQSILNNENNIDYQLYSKTNEDHKLIANSTIESIEEPESELDNLEKTDFDAEIISNESENFPSEEDLGTLNLINTYYTETDDKTTDTQTLINTESEENKTTSTIGRGTESVEDKIIDQEIAIEERFESSAIDNDDFDEKITLSKIPIPDYTTTLDKNSTHTQDNLKSKKHPTRAKPKRTGTILITGTTAIIISIITLMYFNKNKIETKRTSSNLIEREWDASPQQKSRIYLADNSPKETPSGNITSNKETTIDRSTETYKTEDIATDKENTEYSDSIDYDSTSYTIATETVANETTDVSEHKYVKSEKIATLDIKAPENHTTDEIIKSKNTTIISTGHVQIEPDDQETSTNSRNLTTVTKYDTIDTDITETFTNETSYIE
ncbi:MAG: hypothetical protein OQK70_03750, partial [Gammaproteobacteria bacterium]|nr:hypothetical protein [Gammaproteobacteria bacterium]